LTNYYSPFNGLRIGKGALWAFLMYGLLDRMAATGRDVRRPFAWGMVIGLAGTVIVILWERVTFSGPFNFSSDYRVTGPFSQLHTGGAYIEGFLTAAVPFLMLSLFEVRNWLARMMAITLLIGTTYALMVTFSRNGYAAFAIALLLVFAAAIVEFARQRRFAGLRRGVAVLALSALTLAVAVPIFKGEFSQARMSHVEGDLRLRQDHWADALRIRDPGLATAIFGMGVGRYPETHYWRSSESNRSAPHRIEAENGNYFLRIGSGNAIYMEQFVAVEPRQSYLLSLDVRAHKPNSRITVPVCEKWLLTSYECAWQSFDLGPEIDHWRHYERLIASDRMADGRWYARRPVRLTLYNSGGSAAVDVDNVHLVNSEGLDLVNNGDFEHGLDRWFFSTDSHLPWHIKNLWVSVLFDQGWFGVVALGLFVVVAIGRASLQTWNGSLRAGAVLAAISGLLVVGLFDSLIDTPRFLFLFLLLLWMGCLKNSSSAHRAVTWPAHLERAS
jgi:O-antigen ligase